ncbi:hypothetical protein IFR05_000143 [Cadophora sp. M221]|nr:hypothetical protein IFR05_000143 [Cadophora sp. M221]
MPPDSQPGKKRRRTELACTTCRHKKRRCDGLRPRCGLCRDRAHDCVYEPLPTGDTVAVTQQLSPLRHRGERQREGELLQPAEESGSSWKQDASGIGYAPAFQPHENSQQPATLTASHTQTVDVDEDALVDVLATATFNEIVEPGMGYFGPSSNHSIFRSIFVVLVEISRISEAGGLRDATSGLGEDVGEDVERQNDSVPVHADQRQLRPRENTMPELDHRYLLPKYQQLILLVNHYFATVGVAIPFIDKSTIISQYHFGARQTPPRFCRGFLGLISILCALALRTLDDDDAEAYYHQSLTALDLGRSRGWSVETGSSLLSTKLKATSSSNLTQLYLVQALLLIITYQQNNQRSVTSWTTHSLAVKAALQQGLHSPNIRSRQNSKTADLMERLWIGIVFNDLQVFSTNYDWDGIRKTRLSPPPAIAMPPTARSCTSSELWPVEPHRDSCWKGVFHDYGVCILYLDNINAKSCLRSSSTLISTAIEVMYNYNVEAPEEEDFGDLVNKHNRLVELTQVWRERILPFGGVVSALELQGVVDGSFESLRLRILLTIHYHRISLMIHWPVVFNVLKTPIERPAQTPADRLNPRAHFASVAKEAWLTTTELGGLIKALITSSESFLHSNAAWFTCNYTLLTVCLHNFALLLICSHGDNIQVDVSISDIRVALQKNLDNMKPMGERSLMTYNSRRSLMKLLRAFDVLHQKREGGRSLELSENLDLDTLLSEFIGNSNDDFLHMTNAYGALNNCGGYYGNNCWI